MKLVGAREKWLDSRGGRTEEDVLTDSNGREYVLMGDGEGGKARIYLDEHI